MTDEPCPRCGLCIEDHGLTQEDGSRCPPSPFVSGGRRVKMVTPPDHPL